MSRPKNDRKVQSESGKTFQDPDTESFVRAIAGALKAEFGATPSALETVAQLTHSNERTVRNWLEGKNGPTGVLGTVLELADRRDLGLAVGLTSLRARLIDAVAEIDRLSLKAPDDGADGHAADAEENHGTLDADGNHDTEQKT
jgi:hypothetical protein